MIARLALALGSLLLASSFLPTHGTPPLPGPAAESGAPESDWGRVQGALAAWRAQHGASWRVVYDGQVGAARMLHGGSARPPFQPVGDEDFRELARSFLARTTALHGVELSTLVDDAVVFLPLALAGSTDKVTVRLRQELDGVPVLGGFVNVLFDTSGRLLSIDTTGLPRLAGTPTAPEVDGGDGLAVAYADFGAETGLAPTRVVGPRLVLAQHPAGKLRVARLAWEAELFHEAADSAPEGWRYLVDALSGALLERRRAIHHFDVSGQVRSLATPGLAPDGASNPETSQPMPYLRVTSAQGNATTDAAGNFTIPGASAPLSVTVVYEGTYAATNHDPGADYSLTTTLNSGSGNVVLMNPAGNALVTAEANAFSWIGQQRDWTRAVNPADPTSDFLAPANVNLNSTCNAFYNGVSVNFYQAGGGCANTAYSTVVLHEMGHWLNDRYGSGNGSDGFGEGNADVFSMYMVDDPIVGLDFCGSGCNVRTGENTRQFCGDSNPGCYGQVHADGEVLGGALWKVRKRLKNALGTAAGGQAADVLFNAWMNGYDDTQIKSIIEVHWLTLDDDDGNIDNGTPNYAHIDGGFRDQGFPGYTLPLVVFSNLTQLPDTTNEAGPYTVDADIVAAINPPVVAPTLHWRVNGGAWQAQAMAPVVGDTFRGSLPNAPSPAKVEYYVSAEDALGNSNVAPAGAPGTPLKFLVGLQTQFFFEDFEAGLAGWTHGQVATQDDWQRSANVGLVGAGGKSGDPLAAFSGSNIWGNDLGPSGWNGAYADNVENWLRSPAIDLSGAVGSTLVFQRWLTVEQGIYDQATVRVNGVEVWANPLGSDLLDTSWVETEVDISAVADGNPAAVIEFRLKSDGGVVYGGWNLDDVEVRTLESSCGPPTASDPTPVTACVGAPASFSTTAGGGGPFSYQWKKNGVPIGGATGASYSIAAVTPSDAGGYSVLVTGACGSIETAPATLTVADPTTASDPTGATVCAGTPVAFSTTAGGSGPFSYQWRKDGSPIAGATSATYSIASVGLADAGAYTVVVSGACNSVTTAAAVLAVNSPVSSSQPANVTVCPGDPAGFSTTAGGTGPFTYQWKKGGSPIAGATASVYSIAAATPSDAGSYTVEVTGACGSVETAPAALVVNSPVTASAPVGATVCVGDVASFSTTAGGTGPFGYQWLKDGAPLAGATAASYVIPSVTLGDAGAYSVEVTGACGSVSTAAAALTVNTPVSATTPAGATVCEGSPASFATTASGTGPLTYQWKKDGGPIAGATGPSYPIPAVVVGDAGAYSVAVTGACGTFETPAATLSVNSPVTASAPIGATVCVGGLASFSTTAGGTGPFSYQWLKDGAPLAGATAASYVIPSVALGDAGAYAVQVTGACGSVTTAAATLTVNSPVGATTPLDTSGCLGQGVGFSTTASGTGPFTYQWKKDGLVIPPATSSTYTFFINSPSDAGLYSVVVTGACGSIETPGALLTVNQPVSASNPAAATVCVGGTASFTTTVGGSGPLSFQWRKDGVPIPGATAQTFLIPTVAAGDAGFYSVAVTGACGTLTTLAAPLTVNGVTTVYCTSKTNSQGCASPIAASGVPSASAGSGYVVSASLVIPNTNGLFFYSTTGPAAVPFQGGFLCLAAPVTRTPGQSSGGSGPCGGAFAFDFNTVIAAGSDPALVAGAAFWGQIWSRDPASPSTTHLTDAITATICN